MATEPIGDVYSNSGLRRPDVFVAVTPQAYWDAGTLGRWGCSGAGAVAHHEFGHSYAEVVVEHQDFATCNHPRIDKDVDRVAGQLIECDDRSTAQSENILEMHMGPAEFDFKVELNVSYQFERRYFSRCWRTSEVTKFEVTHPRRQGRRL